MRKHRYVAILYIGIVFQLMIIGCKIISQKEDSVLLNPTLDGVQRMEVNDLDPRLTIYIDSILETVQYISLETTEESIIGEIDEVEVTYDHIFILDV